MVRGLYIAGTGMMLQRRRMETITNNIANADTTGYKKEHFLSHSFDEVLIKRINDPGEDGRNAVFYEEFYNRFPYGQNKEPQVGPLNLGTQVDHLYIDFTQGGFEGTERPTDLALQGDVFFVVGTEAGERYTRTGHFYVNDEGYLIDSEGNNLLGENGPIYVGGLDFTVDYEGRVYNAEFQLVDTIRVASFEDNATLRRQGSNLYEATGEPLAEPNEYMMAQGFLESSNVEIGREMVDMLTMYRTYETNQRILTMIDETVGKAVTEIGRIR